MVNRIFLEPSSGARVSLPGFDVLSAQPWELLFQSLNSQLCMKETGEIAFPGYGAFSLNFVNSYINPPIVVLAALYSVVGGVVQSNSDYRFLAFGGITQVDYSAAGYTRPRYTYFRAQASSTGISYNMAAYDPFLPGPCPPSYVPYPLRYYVFDMEF